MFLDHDAEEVAGLSWIRDIIGPRVEKQWVGVRLSPFFFCFDKESAIFCFNLCNFFVLIRYISNL